MHTALLLLGGNLGNVKEAFDQAAAELEKHGRIRARSGLYRTAAWGMGDVPDFLNQALVLETELEPDGLLSVLQQIEEEAGRFRDKSPGYQSRELDIDILLIDDLTIDSDHLVVPHPRMHERNFTLVPAAEIAGNWLHPVFRKSVDALRAETADTLKVVAV